MSDHHRAYKVRTDGSERTQLTFDGDAIHNLMLIDDWLYYSSMSRPETLIKMSTDGSTRSSFDGISRAYGLNYHNGWFYYYNWNNHNKIYKVRLDNSENSLVCNDSAYLINIVGDWIYYVNSSENDKFYRVRTDGSGKAASLLKPAALPLLKINIFRLVITKFIAVVNDYNCH